MKDENAFNADLTRKFKKIRNLYVIKAADKYTPGISDFLLWSGGKGAFLETKFIRKLPARKTTNLLKHTFSSEQVSFLRGMTNVAGCPAWGAIGVFETKTIYTVPSFLIPFEGNWKVGPFLDSVDNLYENKPSSYSFDDVETLVKDIFAEASKPIFDGPIIHVN